MLNEALRGRQPTLLKKNRGLSSQKLYPFITYHHITFFHSLLLALFLHTFIINLPSHNLYSSSSPSLTPPPTNLHQTDGTINPPHQNQHQTTTTILLPPWPFFWYPPHFSSSRRIAIFTQSINSGLNLRLVTIFYFAFWLLTVVVEMLDLLFWFLV